MKHFYSVLLLLASASLWAMDQSHPSITTSDSSSTTVISAPSSLLSQKLKAKNLNPLEDQNWSPEKASNPLFGPIRKPNLGDFQWSYQNYPLAFRNEAILNGCGHVCYRTAVALENKQSIINEQIKAGQKHDYLTIGKNFLKEIRYLGISLLLANTAKVMINSIDEIFRPPYASLPGATDTKFIAKLSVILLASAIGISTLPLHFDAIKGAIKAWYYQDTLKQANKDITNSLDQIQKIDTFIDETKNTWIPGSYIVIKSYNAELLSQKDSKQEDIK